MVDTGAFIRAVAPGAQACWTKYGVLASLTIAQAILESGWGQSYLGSAPNYNLFGIKANGWTSPNVVYINTKEWDGSKYITVKAAFRKYSSYAGSIEDHALFLVQNKRYSNLIGVKDYRTVCQLIKADGYATAPDYAQKLIRIIEQYGLNKYDSGSGGSVTPRPSKLCAYAGARIRLQNAAVYYDSYGGTYATRVSGVYTVDRVINGRKAGVLYGGGKGWVSPNDCYCA